MTFELYPRPGALALRVPHAAPARTETAFAQIAGDPPPEHAGEYDRTMFVRLARLSGTASPTVTLKADTGAPIILDTNPQAIFALPGQGGYSGAAWMTGDGADTFDITVGLTGATEHGWTLGIANSDDVDQHYVWVVADSPEQTRQPWNDPAPPACRLTNQIPTALCQFPRIAVDSSTHVAYVINSYGSSELWTITDGKVDHRVGLPVSTGRIAVDPHTHALWITEGDQVKVLEGGTVTSTVPVGPVHYDGRADGVAVNATARLVYVTNSASNTVTIIDADHRSVVATVPVGAGNHCVAVAANTTTAYVSNRADNTVTVVGPAGAQATLPVASAPGALAVGRGDHTVYVCSTDQPALSVIDTATGSVSTLDLTTPLGGKPASVAVDADRFVLYVAVPGTKTDSRLYAIDSRTGLVPADGIPIWRAPDLEVDAGTGTLYVACQQSVDAFVGVLVVEPAR